MKYFNHKITAIEDRLKSCGIVLLEKDQAEPSSPPEEVGHLNFGFNR